MICTIIAMSNIHLTHSNLNSFQHLITKDERVSYFVLTSKFIFDSPTLLFIILAFLFSVFLVVPFILQLEKIS